jgi:hypothetical protein
MAFLLFAVVVVPTLSSYAAGIRMKLHMPRTSVAVIYPDKSEIGFAQTQDSLALFKYDSASPRLTFSYDASSQMLVFNQDYGKFEDVTLPAAASPVAYRKWLLDNQSRRMWRDGYQNLAKKTKQDTGGSLLQFDIPFKVPKLAKTIMGEGGAGLKVNGYRRISFSGTSQWEDKASTATVKQSKFPSLNMEQQSSFTIGGNIGSKIFVDVNQDSKRQQSLANRIQLRYKGDEDDVVKTVELGNTNLSLPGTRFTGYSRQIQGLFGIKTTAELGGLKLTAIASQEKSSNQGASFKAGSESQTRVIRDYQYLDNTYFDLVRRDTVSEGDLLPGDTITDLQLFFSVNTNVNNSDITTDARPCSLFVDPFRKEEFTNETVGGKFLPYKTEYSGGGTYWYHNTSFYVVMDRPVTSDISIGAYITFRRNGVDHTIGSQPNGSTYTLKLIAHANPQPTYKTWNYVWRNVYSLGGAIDNPDNLEVKIYKGNATSTADRDPSELDNQAGTPYIQLMGLDNDKNGQIDGSNAYIVDRARGHLRFPNTRPFADPVLTDKVDALYTSASQTDRNQASKYYLLVNSSTRQSEFYLGHSDIVSESETVTLNGKALKRDVDYRLSYDLGRITFLNQDALNPGADVKVDYEYAPLIAAEKKTLLGARGEYAIGSNFKIGTTVLYKSQKTTDRKPRIGEEQSKSLNLDADMSYAFDSKLITKMVDALPFLETNAPSRVSFDGEVARSVPNPNTAGEAFIDDFEGAREQFSLGVTREGWHYSSTPATKEAAVERRAKLVWYNPYDQVPVTDIYDRQVKAGENRQHVLTMHLNPKIIDTRLGHVPDTLANPGSPDPAVRWGGIMKAFSKGAYDQSQTQYVELRMKGTAGVLHLDFGEITEELFETDPLLKGKVVTEDTSGDGILTDQEDIGLDRAANSLEQKECNCQLSDPHGDDWIYSSSDPYNYDHINGTEGNGKDPGTNGRPDTEDLNGDGNLNTNNNYYSYTIDIANRNQEFIVPNSENARGWYTVRIPFTSVFADSVGGPSRANITMVRLWMDGVTADTGVTIQIADIQMTRTLWESKPLLPEGAFRSDSAGVKVSVINTEENADYVNNRPPGVGGYYDPTTQLTEKEQSLRLNFKEMLPGDTAYAEKIPFKVQDLTGYKKIEMWVHGDSVRDSLQFFFRFGPDASNYYEFRTTLDSGWSSKNSVNIAFDDITQLKLIPKDTISDSTHVPTPPSPIYRVVGSPSLTRIKYYAMGAVNLNSKSSQRLETGEIWVDELRATGVRNDKGLAAVAATTITLGDAGSFRADYSTQDAFYRNLTQSDRNDLGSGSSNTNYGYSADFKLDKFLSPNEKANIPISYSWRRTESSPRLITGSDITVPASLTEAQKTVSTATHFGIGESWAKPNGNIIYGALLNKFTSNFSYDKSVARSPNQPYSSSERYTLKGRYAVASPVKHGLKIFSWLQGMPLIPKRVLGTEFNPIPARLSLDGTVNRSLDASVNSFNTQTNRYLRTFQGRFETAFTPLNSVDASYNFSTDRDLNNPDLLKFSFNPVKARLGVERQYNQGFSTNYSPQLLPFITSTKFGYSVNHSENFVQTSTFVEEIGTRRIDNSRSFTANANLDLQRLLGRNPVHVSKPPSKVSPEPRKGWIDKADSLSKKGGGKDKPKNVPPDSLGRQVPSKDSTKVPGLDSLRQGTEPSKPTVPDTAKDTTGTKGGKKSSYNVPKLTSQTFALVFASPASDSTRPPASGQGTTPPKDPKKDEPRPPLVFPSAPADSTAAKTDTTGAKPGQGKGTDADALKDKYLQNKRGLGGDTLATRPESAKGSVKAPKLPGTPFYSFGLKFVRLFTDRIDPIGGSFRWEERNSMSGFLERPSFLYRIGFSENPNADRIKSLGSGINQTDMSSWSKGYSLKSGVRLILDIKVGTSYSYSTSDATGKATQDASTIFPDLTFGFGKVDYLLIPKLFSKTFSIDSRYSRKVSTSLSKRTGKLRSRTTTLDYSPLVSIKIDWKFAQGLISTINYAKSSAGREDWDDSGDASGLVKDFVNTLAIKTSYSFRGGSKFWLPLFGTVKIQSTLSFDLDISKRVNRTVDYNPNKALGETAKRSDFSVQPRITYNFSTNIKGGLSARWQDSNDLRSQKKSHVRALESWVEIRF